MDTQKTFTTGQFAKAVGRCVKTVQAWDREGRLTARRTISGRRYYTQADIDKALGK